VMKALAKRVEDRYQSAAAMRSDIERYLAGRPVHAVVPPAPPTSMIPPVADPTPTGTTAVPVQDDERDRSRAVLLFLLGFLVIALIAGAAFLLPRMFESPPEEVQVPSLIGMTEEEARAAIGEAGLAVGDISFRADSDVKRDEVLEQDPNPSQYVAPDTEIDLVLSSGKPLVEVPYVIGDQRGAAGNRLREAGFEVRFEERESDERGGQVLATDPTPGESVPEGSVVTIFYSDGPEEVPDVIGDQQEEAEAKLREAGFEPKVVESTATTEPKGTVIDQSPEGGEDAPEGSTVTIVVSAYEEPTEPTDSSPTESPTAPTESPSANEKATTFRREGAALQRMGWA